MISRQQYSLIYIFPNGYNRRAGKGPSTGPTHSLTEKENQNTTKRGASAGSTRAVHGAEATDNTGNTTTTPNACKIPRQRQVGGAPTGSTRAFHAAGATNLQALTCAMIFVGGEDNVLTVQQQFVLAPDTML